MQYYTSKIAILSLLPVLGMPIKEVYLVLVFNGTNTQKYPRVTHEILYD